MLWRKLLEMCVGESPPSVVFSCLFLLLWSLYLFFPGKGKKAFFIREGVSCRRIFWGGGSCLDVYWWCVGFERKFCSKFEERFGTLFFVLSGHLPGDIRQESFLCDPYVPHVFGVFRGL